MSRAVRVDRARAIADPGGPARAIRETLADFQATVMRGRTLDPVITELVRLRCARSHDCRICKTLRMADADVDETLAAKVDRYRSSDLPERARVALALTDAIIGWPHDLDQALVEQMHQHFSPAELAELCLDVAKWSTQKINVSLGLDGADALPLNAAGVSYLSFDEDGRPMTMEPVADHGSTA